MARPALNRPTDAELTILRILWRRDACTVREVHEELNRERPVGYTSVLKVMQIMAEKGLVARDQRSRAHVYRAAAPQERTLTQLAGDLLERAFDGSAKALLLHALSAKPSTSDELGQIRRLIEEFEAAQRSSQPPAKSFQSRAQGGKS